MQNTVLTQLAAALTGSLGFCIMFRIRKELLLPAALGGMFSWGVYLFAIQRGAGIFAASLAAAFFGALYAELLARLLKAPSTIFSVSSMFPLMPGGSLYRTMQSVVTQDWDGVQTNGSLTVQYALGIAAGMCLVWALCDMSRKLRRR